MQAKNLAGFLNLPLWFIQPPAFPALGKAKAGRQGCRPERIPWGFALQNPEDENPHGSGFLSAQGIGAEIPEAPRPYPHAKRVD
jgi:hypothetical protein